MNRLYSHLTNCGIRLRELLYLRQQAVVLTAFLLSGALLLMTSLTDPSLAQCAGPLGSCAEPGYQDDLVRNAVASLFQLIEGAFGALIMVVAGLGAIVASAMGAYRAALGMLIVAVGAFILRSLVTLFFGADYTTYEYE